MTSASLALVGAALFIDGARRLTKDPTVRRLAADFKDGVLHLVKVESEAFIDSLAGLQRCFDEELRPFLEDLAKDPKSSAATAAIVAAGAAGGQAAAAASVTLLGSSSLGALGVSLGLVSAPLWPVIAGGGVGLVLAYGAWKVVKQRGKRRMTPLMQLPALHGPADALGLPYEKPDA